MATKIPLETAKMADTDKNKCVDALRRILAPQKGFHQPTLIAMLGESFDIEKGDKEK